LEFNLVDLEKLTRSYYLHFAIMVWIQLPSCFAIQRSLGD